MWCGRAALPGGRFLWCSGGVSDPERGSADGGEPGPRDVRRDRRWTIGELLTWTTDKFGELGLDEPRLDAQRLLAHSLGCSRMDLYVQHHRLLDADERGAFRALVKRRIAREPVAYIEGSTGFHALDLELAVDRRVLVPRPDTELLVDWVLETLRPSPAPIAKIVDVGTGSGAIALALARARDDLEVHAVEIDEAAASVAKANVTHADLPVRLHRGDLLSQLEAPAGGWDVVVANLPYIPSADIEGLDPEVRDYEPRLALDGGSDGLDLIRRLLEQVAGEGVLSPRGAVFLEFGVGQARDVIALMETSGFLAETRKDLGGVVRAARGHRPLR